MNVIKFPDNMAKKCFFFEFSPNQIWRKEVEDTFLRVYPSREKFLASLEPTQQWANDDYEVLPLNDFLSGFENLRRDDCFNGWATFVFIDEDGEDELKRIQDIFVSSQPDDELTANKIGAHYHTLSQLQADLNDSHLDDWSVLSGEYGLFVKA